MFISFSKTVAKFGGFRIGIGKRITAKNAWWLCFVICIVATMQLMWYLLLLCFWLMYAMLYGIWWCCKKIIQFIVSAINKKRNNALKNSFSINTIEYQNDNTNNQNTAFSEHSHQNKMDIEIEKKTYCPNCGALILEGNSFCIKCGKQMISDEDSLY